MRSLESTLSSGWAVQHLAACECWVQQQLCGLPAAAADRAALPCSAAQHNHAAAAHMVRAGAPAGRPLLPLSDDHCTAPPCVLLPGPWWRCGALCRKEYVTSSTYDDEHPDAPKLDEKVFLNRQVRCRPQDMAVCTPHVCSGGNSPMASLAACCNTQHLPFICRLSVNLRPAGHHGCVQPAEQAPL